MNNSFPFQNAKIEFKTEVPTDLADRKCGVQVQKETNEGLEDTVCGEYTEAKMAGYCQ